MVVLTNLYNDEVGFLVSTELILVTTIVVIGLITGLTSIRDAAVNELSSVANAIQDMNQSFTFSGTQSNSAATFGSDGTVSQIAEIDFQPRAIESCIAYFGQPTNSGRIAENSEYDNHPAGNTR